MNKSQRLIWTGATGAFTLAVLAAAVVLSITVFSTGEAKEDELSPLRREINRYQNPQKAEKDGWVLLSGLDHCFDNPGTGGMGFHYINPNLLDTTLNETTPEALVYAPRGLTGLELAAVEFIVPAAPWDEDHSVPPTIHGHDLHLNANLGVYVLHIWLFEHNSAGMFEDWNPDVSCPSPIP